VADWPQRDNSDEWSRVAEETLVILGCNKRMRAREKQKREL